MDAPKRGTLRRVMGRVRRLSRYAGQCLDSLPVRMGHRTPPIPGPKLLHLIGGTCDARWFLGSGQAGAATVRDALAGQGVRLEDCEAVLDFGCGVGRVMRHWRGVQGPRFHGTDYNPRLIAWCRRHLPFAAFGVNGLDPGLAYPDGSFDVAYAFSVFTHLTSARQEAWMSELRRLVRPGGHLILSLHGEFYLQAMSDADRARFRTGGMVVVGGGRDGTNDCATFHPPSYVRIVLARDWEVCAHMPEGARGNPAQDLYVLRRPATRGVRAA